jgi:hypothetical protein
VGRGKRGGAVVVDGLYWEEGIERIKRPKQSDDAEIE